MAQKPLLTIGLAVFDDFDGLAFTVQSLRLYHAEAVPDCEILVVDNNPTSRAGQRTKDFCAKAGVTYAPLPSPQGTAAPRDWLFRIAKADAVLCLDSHVLLAPGTVARVIQWFAERPGTRDMLQGPIVWDDLGAIHPEYGSTGGLSTHFDPAWGGGMFGRWGYDARAAADPDGEFEIEMMGLGLFAMRKEAWVGFNPRFAGFGGEEGYVHEKVRRAGGRVVCAAWLKWWHRFSDAAHGVAYPLLVEDKVWNYCVGWGELGWDLTPVREHFTHANNSGNVIPAERFDSIAVAAATGVASPPHRAAAEPCTTCDQRTSGDPEQVGYAPLAEWVAKLGGEGKVYEHSVTSAPASAVLGSHAGPVVIRSARSSGRAIAARRGRENMQVLVGPVGLPAVEAELTALTGYTDGRNLLPALEAAGKTSRRFIAVDNTGVKDTAQGPGPLTGIQVFVQKAPEWSVLALYEGGPGLAVLGKLAKDKPQLPGLAVQGTNALKAAAGLIRNVTVLKPVLVSPERKKERLQNCATCPARKDGKCTDCGCVLAAKAAVVVKKQDCPRGKWPVEPSGRD